MPTISLPKFDGDALNWPHFWDLYKSTIHSREDISGASKFHYLVSQLTGEAAQLLAGFSHTEGEYVEAVNLLVSTYGQENRIIQAYLHAVFDLKSPKATAQDLSAFRSKYEGHLRGLKTLGRNVDEAGYVFAAVIIRKLPNRIRDNINRAAKSNYWNLDDLRAAIQNEIGHLQAAEIPELSSRKKFITGSDARPESNLMGGTAMFSVTTTGVKILLSAVVIMRHSTVLTTNL